MVEENTTEDISLLFVEGIQVNKKLDRMRVLMRVIHIFKALGFLWLKLSGKKGGVSTLITSKDLQSPELSAWLLLSSLHLKRKELKT